MGKIANIEMPYERKVLASGEGWQVEDVRCTASPADPSFAEQHGVFCAALVIGGHFDYRSSSGAATLVPGSVLLGNAGECYECGHEHSAGDRCLSFHFSGAVLEEVASGMPGAVRASFDGPSLPPTPSLISIVAAAHSACEAGESELFEELCLAFAGRLLHEQAGDGSKTSRRASPTSRHRRGVVAAVDRIRESPTERHSLDALAREAAMSRYHFLRMFNIVVGMTPHQYLLQIRLHDAAVRLRQTDESISSIALDAGFDDLSTFNKRFRKITGMNPKAYRKARWSDRGTPASES